MKKNLLALAIAAAAMSAASAETIWTSTGPTSEVAGVCTVDFDGSTCAGVSYAVAPGNVMTGSTSASAQPAGSSGNYLTVGPTNGSPVDITIDAGSNQYNYFGLLAGSLDAYNTIQFTLTDASVLTFSGSQLAAAAGYSATGNQQQSVYWNLHLGNNTFFTQIRLSSSSDAFESDNHAFGNAQVPVPATLALLGLGLLGLGAAGRRRI